MHQSVKIIYLIIFSLFVLGNGQSPPELHNLSQGDDFSGDISRFLLEPLPNPDEISGNVVGPKKMPGVNFTSIQDALDQSIPGETIYVLSGDYNENLNLSKPGVILRGVDTGEGAPVVSAVGHSSTITITASACTVDGFVVMNSGNPEAGILIFSENNRISNNTIKYNKGYGLHSKGKSDNIIYGNKINNNGFDGICLENSSNNSILYNSVIENGINGIYLKNSDNNVLKGNEIIKNSKYDILLENSNNNIIIDNSYDRFKEINSQDNINQGNTNPKSEENLENSPTEETVISPPDEILFLQVPPGGDIQQAINSISPGGSIHLLGGTYSGPIVLDKANIAIIGDGFPEIQGNEVDSTITLSGSGASLSGLVVTNSGNPHSGIDVRAPNCIIRGCQIRDNHGYGITIISSSGTRITDNTIANNGLGGITMESSQNNQIDRNRITSNGASKGGYGISLQSSSENTIYQNTLDNANNAWSDSVNNWHSSTAIEYKGNTTYVGNIWSDYAGWDCNGDGIGDSPYLIPGGSEQDSFPLTNRTGTTLTVCVSGCDFTSIQAAINAACPGDTIEVESGTYYENVIVNKTLILMGVGSPVVDGSGTGNAITVNADGCTIQGFVARNSGSSNSGIYVTSSGNTISGNNANGNRFGIYLASSSNNNTISDNLATGNGDGISLYSSSSNIISGNTATDNADRGINLNSSSNNNIVDNDVTRSYLGIYLYSSSNSNTISGNTISGNTATGNPDGITLYSLCDSNTISDNIVTGKHCGIYLDKSSSNIISRNTVNNNSWGGIYLASYSNNNTISGNTANNDSDAGIIIYNHSDNNKITGNTATGNENGIKLFTSSNNNIEDNDVIGNNKGINLVVGPCSDNIIFRNNFDNIINAWSDSSNNWHSPTEIEYKGNTTYVGNSWSDYSGWDCNGDGIGDSPYPIPGGSEQDSFPLTNRTGTRTLTVCASGCNFTSIQAAINAACPGDTIEAESGTYFENVDVNKSLTLNGVGSPVVDGSGTENSITVNADGCTIQGFVARNSGAGAGIMINSKNNTISSNTATDNRNGIYLLASSSNIISGNTANNNSEAGIFLSHSSYNDILDNDFAYSIHGIILQASSYNTMDGNTIFANDCGVYLLASTGNQILSNIAVENRNNSITLDSSSSNSISSNRFEGNEAEMNLSIGIILQASSHNTMDGNTIIYNRDGIYLQSSSNSNTISNNHATTNSERSICLESSSSNTIFGNHFENAWSDGDNLWNTVHKVIYNYVNAPPKSTEYYNHTGNYWSGYSGPDGNYDGIGDVPYSIGGGSEKDYYPLLEGVTLNTSDSIQISQDGSLKTGLPSSNAQYVLMVTNLGDSELTNISITDQLSKGIDVVFVENGLEPDVSLEEENGTRILKWSDPGPLRPGETKQIDLVALIEDELPETLISKANVQAISEDGQKLSDEDTLELNAAANISIEKEADPSFAQPSDLVKFSINITNTGQKELVSVMVNDTLPKGISYVSDDINATVSGDLVSWPDLGPMQPGESKFIRLVGVVKEDASGMQTNAVSVTANTTQGGVVFDSDSTNVDILSLNVSKEADRKTVKRGENITYTITICNTGSLPLDNVIAWDAIDSQVILLYSSMETQEDGKWHLGTLAPGQCAVITLMVQVPKTNLKFDMQSSVSGEGYVNVADDYSTTLPELVIKNTIRALSTSTNKQIQDTSLVTVLGEAGTELSSREHGSGLYQSDEKLRMIMENKSIQMNKSVTASQQPVVLRLYDKRTVNSSSPWTERVQARNRITGTSMTGSFSHAQNISLESQIKLDQNESVMEQSSEFDGLGRFDLQKKQVDGKTSLLDIQEDYAGSFKVYQKIDEYGSSVIAMKSASGSGFVGGDRRIGKSQRSHESGTGNYSSQEDIQTYTNYIYKDIDLTTSPVSLNSTISIWPNRPLNWSEGIYSRNPGSTYLGEEYRNLVDMEKQTQVTGLNSIQTEANFTGSARYRQAMEGEMDLEQEYIGKYSIRQKTRILGTARYDRPHINVIKDGEIISQSNLDKTYARYTITVENDGNKLLSPVYVTDLFPPGALYVNSSLRPRLTSSSANWTLTHMSVGGRSEITLWLEMGENQSDTLVNRVEASGSHDAGWAYASNISVAKSGWLVLPPSDNQIVVKKSAYVNETASDFVWYYLSIENLCNCTASLIVTDSLPQGMKLVEATPDITSFNQESNTITWNFISLKPQDTIFIIYKVFVTKGGRLVNQVKVEAVSLEGCDILPAYASSVLTIGNKSSETSSDDWTPPKDWDLQCSGTSCP